MRRRPVSMFLALRVLVLVEHEVDEEGGANEGGLYADVEVLGEGDGEGAHVGAHLAAALGPLLGDGPDLALTVAPSHLRENTDRTDETLVMQGTSHNAI